MKKTTLAMSALALSLGLALSPLSVSAAETASAIPPSQQMPSLAPMLEKVMPSVVSINVEGSTTVNTPRMGRNFQQFFGENSPFCQEGSPFQSSPFCQGGQGGADDGGQQQKFMALGSGVIIDAAKGYVVTNNHVVDNASTIKVQLGDGRKFDAKVVGKDPRSDLALVQIQDPKNLTAIKLADSDALRVGDYTVAIGNPFGLGETVTSGIVSALGRSGLNAENYENFIQTDAAI
ncbi:MAG TPA: serine endoprotease, partial [Enterobacteriaceae bacterium]|nr:serine endoprotease [Enterobacteriaceae bacterium]